MHQRWARTFRGGGARPDLALVVKGLVLGQVLGLLGCERRARHRPEDLAYALHEWLLGRLLQHQVHLEKKKRQHALAAGSLRAPHLRAFACEVVPERVACGGEIGRERRVVLRLQDLAQPPDAVEARHPHAELAPVEHAYKGREQAGEDHRHAAREHDLG